MRALFHYQGLNKIDSMSTSFNQYLLYGQLPALYESIVGAASAAAGYV